MKPNASPSLVSLRRYVDFAAKRLRDVAAELDTRATSIAVKEHEPFHQLRLEAEAGSIVYGLIERRMLIKHRHLTETVNEDPTIAERKDPVTLEQLRTIWRACYRYLRRQYPDFLPPYFFTGLTLDDIRELIGREREDKTTQSDIYRRFEGYERAAIACRLLAEIVEDEIEDPSKANGKDLQPLKDTYSRNTSKEELGDALTCDPRVLEQRLGNGLHRVAGTKQWWRVEYAAVTDEIDSATLKEYFRKNPARPTRRQSKAK